RLAPRRAADAERGPPRQSVPGPRPPRGAGRGTPFPDGYHGRRNHPRFSARDVLGLSAAVRMAFEGNSRLRLTAFHFRYTNRITDGPSLSYQPIRDCTTLQARIRGLINTRPR